MMTMGEYTPDTRRADPNKEPDKAMDTGLGDIFAIRGEKIAIRWYMVMVFLGSSSIIWNRCEMVTIYICCI